MSNVLSGVCKLWSQGLYFRAPLTLNRTKIRLKINISCILKNVSTGFLWHYFLSSLELLWEVFRMWASRGHIFRSFFTPNMAKNRSKVRPLGPAITGQIGPNLCWKYLGRLLVQLSLFESYTKAFWPLDAHWLCHFPWGLLSGSRYMSVNTGLIFALIIYRGHMVTFNTRLLFTPILTWYVLIVLII